MAASIECVKCKNTSINQSEKIIKCNGKCNHYLHHTCSSFKPTELKIFETHSRNVKWYCDVCVSSKNDAPMDVLCTKVEDLSTKLEEMLNIIKEQTIKIESQGKIIANLQNKQTVRQQTIGQEKETVNAQKPQQSIVQEKEPIDSQRPITRSKTATLDGTIESVKSYVKVVNTQVKKNDTQKQQTCTSLVAPADRKTNLRDIVIMKNSLAEKPETNAKNTQKQTVRGNRRNTSLIAAENRKWIFISQLIHTTSEDDIKEYLSENKIDIINCEKLQIKSENISAFKIGVNEKVYEKMFNPNLWPANVIVRPYRFRNFRKVTELNLKR